MRSWPHKNPFELGSLNLSKVPNALCYLLSRKNPWNCFFLTYGWLNPIAANETAVRLPTLVLYACQVDQYMDLYDAYCIDFEEVDECSKCFSCYA